MGVRYWGESVYGQSFRMVLLMTNSSGAFHLHQLVYHAMVAFVGTVAFLFPALAQVPVDIKVALVIGNSAYPGAPLLNPANDARAMSDTLRGLGFTVVQLRDSQKEQMADAIASVRDILKGKQGVGML